MQRLVSSEVGCPTVRDNSSHSRYRFQARPLAPLSDQIAVQESHGVGKFVLQAVQFSRRGGRESAAGLF